MTTSESQRPVLRSSGLTIYCITRYLELPDGKFKAIEKFDVTDDLSKLFNHMLDGAVTQVKKNRLVGNVFIANVCGLRSNRLDVDRVIDDLTVAGHIVTMSLVFGSSDELTDIQKNKIELCDVLYVVDVFDSMPDGVQSHIDYALEQGKQIQYLHHIEKNVILG